MSENNALQSIVDGKIQRKLSNPYFLFRTKDRMGSYFDRSHYRIVHFQKEPLTQFLPSVKHNPDDRTVNYDVSAIDATTLRKMAYLPDTLIKDFEKAAREFYGLDGFDSRVNEAEKTLRLHFKLPDPRIEPDSYWLHGPRDDLKFFILWGTEFKEGSSIPLCPVPGKYPEGNTVLDRLKEMKMSWENKQEETIALLRARKHPLSSFLANPVADKKGNPEGVMVEGQKILLKDLAPLKRFSASEFKRFKNAVDDFYDSCAIESTELSAYEKELRCSFRLPDPEVVSSSYFLHKGKLVILMSNSVNRENSLIIDDREDLNLPPQHKDEFGNEIGEDTIINKLALKLHPTKLYTMIATATAAVVILTGVLSWLFWVDGTPPEITSVASLDDFETVTVTFSEPVDPLSLIDAATAQANGQQPSFIIARLSDGANIKIINASLDSDDELGSTVTIKTEPLKDGEEYRLVSYNIQDVSMKSNVIEPGSEKIFQPLDTLPPSKPILSAHPSDSRKLVLVFNEPLDKKSAEKRDNYTLPNEDFRVSSVQLAPDGKTIEITADRVDRTAQERGFIDGGIYSLQVYGVADNSFGKNVATDPYIFQNFPYIDQVAPMLTSVRPLSQFDVEVSYNESVTPESALKTSNYAIIADSGATPQILSVEPFEDSKRVLAKTSGLFNGIKYTAEIKDISDQSNQKNVAASIVSEPFMYAGREDKDPPEIAKVRVLSSQDELSVLWNEPVDADLSTVAANYSLINNPEVTVINVSKRNTENTLFAINLSTKLEKHREYQLVINNISDRVGNSTREYHSPKFRSALVFLSRNIQIENIEVVSKTEVNVNLNEELINFENRVSDQSYFSIHSNPPGESHFVIKAIALNPENKKQIKCTFDSTTPLLAGNYIFRIEPGMRIEGNKSKDQIGVEKGFSVK